MIARDLTHLETGQLIKSSVKDLEIAAINTTTEVRIKNYVNQMIADIGLFDKGLLKIKKNQETEELARLDQMRDLSLTAFNRQL